MGLKLVTPLKKRKSDLQKTIRAQALRRTKMAQLRSGKKQKIDEEPTYRQINECIQLLQSTLYDKNPFKIISILFNNLIHNKKAKSVTNQEEKSTASGDEVHRRFDPKKWQELTQNNKMVERKTPFRKYYSRQAFRDKKFVRDDQQYLYRQKKIVAKAFVDRQYGIPGLEDEIAQSKSLIIIKKCRYHALMRGVATQAFRTLQYFLIHECKRSIRFINKYQMAAVHKILINCRGNLPTQDSNTFIKFIKIAYGLYSVTVTQDSAVKLYILLQNYIRSRIGSFQLDKAEDKNRWLRYQNQIKKFKFNKKQFDKFFTKDKQLNLVSKYIESREYGIAKKNFDQLYHNHRHLFTIDIIKGKITSVVRFLMKKLMFLLKKYQNYQLPKFIKIDGQDLRHISRSSDSTSLRIQIMKFYFFPKKLVLPKLRQIINGVNQYVVLKQTKRCNRIIEKREKSNTVVEKLDFNINITRTKLREAGRKYQQKQLVLKGKQRNFQHFLNIENGQNLHYFRKVDDQPPVQKRMGDLYEQIKRQQQQVKFQDYDQKQGLSSLSQEQRQLNYMIYEQISRFEKQYKNQKNQENDSQVKQEISKYQLMMAQYLKKLDIGFDKL